MSAIPSRIELWERSMASLSDSVFLDLLKNFIGKVPTPFHRPQLVKQLTTLFSSEDFITRVEVSLSESDCRLLTGCAILGCATQDELCSLLIDEYPYAAIQQNVVNLEERLLLVPDPESIGSRPSLMLNPLLMQRLLSKSLAIGHLLGFPAEGDSPLSWHADKRIVRALASLHMHASLGNLERSERLLASRHAKSIFGAEDARSVERLLLYNRLLFVSDIVVPNGKNVRVSTERLQMVLNEDEKSLGRRLFSTLLQHIHPQDRQRYEREVQIFYETFHQLLAYAWEDDPLVLKKICTIASHRSALAIGNMDEFIRLLRVTGVWKHGRDGDAEDSAVTLRPTLDSDLTISFTGDVQPVGNKDILHCISVVRKVDVVTSYEISKPTILRAFDLGLSASHILAYLEGLTHTTPASLNDLIRHWEAEFGAITIYDGILVKTDERLGRIIKVLPAVQSHIIRIIEDTLFLMARSTEQQWREILGATGVLILPSSISEHTFPQSSQPPSVTLDTPQPPIRELRMLLGDLGAQTKMLQTEQGDRLQHELRSLIDAKRLQKAQKEELVARLERKLILTASQIDATVGRTQTLEASGFDFQGKLNLCKAAVNSSVDLLELHMLEPDGGTHVLLTEVKEFIRDSKEAAIRVRVLPNGEERVILIDKVFRVRKLRRSIFFQA